MFWPCREIGPNGEQCALDAGHDGQHVPRAAAAPAVTAPPTPAGALPPPVASAPPPAGALPPPVASAPPPAGPPAPVYAAPPPAYPAIQPVTPAVTGAPWGGPPKGRARGPLVVVGLGVVALLVVGLGAVVALGGDSGEPGDPGSSSAPSRPALVIPGATSTAGAVDPGASPTTSPVEPVASGPSPSTGVRPITLPTASGTPTRTPAPVGTTSPPVAPGPGATSPAGTPAPSPRPLGFGTLSYSGAACFEVDWKDAKGRQISGAEARYAITIRNPRGVKSANLWIGIQTTDQFTTDPLISRASWSKRPKAVGDETSLIIAGPRLDAGKTRLTWRVFYQTPIDVHTRIWIAEGPSPTKGTMTLDEIEAASPFVWDVKTNIKVCY